MEYKDISEFEQKIGYKFKKIEFLEEAFRHRSFVNEQALPFLRDNERLEFLGDAVLNLVIGHVLMIRYPDLKEGELSRMRASLVNERTLAVISSSLEIGSNIRLSKGEIQTHGPQKKSILADTLEAVFAAVYLDSDFQTVFRIISDLFSSTIDVVAKKSTNYDYKSRFQELVQVTMKEVPVYSIVREKGPDHDKTFRVQLKTSDLIVHGTGKSKKMAEQDAAKAALKILKDLD
jgi:ribonuclease III